MIRVRPWLTIEEENDLYLEIDAVIMEIDRQQEEVEFDHRRRNPRFRKQESICKHWLRGTCKFKEYECPYQHVFDERLMPVCQFFVRGECTNPDCYFLHPGRGEEVLCVQYATGFCKLGTKCPWKHRRHTREDFEYKHRQCVDEAETSQRSYRARNRRTLEELGTFAEKNKKRIK